MSEKHLPSSPGYRPGPRRAIEIGERVFLRFPVAGDCDAWTDLRRLSGRFLSRWEPALPDGQDPTSAEAFRRILSRRRREDMRVFCVCHRETGELLGQLSLYTIVRGELQNCVIGYWIGKPHARKGYMTEAVGLAVRHAFSILGLHRVEANIMTTNAASIALAKRCGFRFEGVSKRYFRIRGRFRDHERWAITVEDLRRRRKSARRSSQ